MNVNCRKRKQLRLKRYDYSSNGYYFVTIGVKNKQRCLEGCKKMIISALESMPARFKGVSIDYFTIMPNHLHIIFVFQDSQVSLGKVVRSFKAVVGRFYGTGLWQRGYYEHIIRSEKALNKIRRYIENNPVVEKIHFEQFYV